MTAVPAAYELGAEGSDARRLVGMLRGFGITPRRLRLLTLPWPPEPKGRPRFTRTGKTYMAAVDRKREQKLADFFVVQRIPVEREPLALACLFYRQDRRAMDLDNMCKTIGDAGNHILWTDDALIVAEASVRLYDKRSPRTVMAWCAWP